GYTASCGALHSRAPASRRPALDMTRHRLLSLALTAAHAAAAPVAAQKSASAPAGRTLDIYVTDTEGGKATLFVSPSGETVLIDTGNPGARDLGRILQVLG